MLFFQQTPDVEDCGLIENGVELQAVELTHGRNLNEVVIHALIAAAIPLLQKINVQHAVESIGPAIGLVGCRSVVVRLNGAQQFIPGSQLLRLSEKLLAPSQATFAVVLGVGERQLLHCNLVVVITGAEIFHRVGLIRDPSAA